MPTAFVRLSDIETEHKLWKNPRETTGLSDKELDELAADIKAAGDANGHKDGKIVDPPKCVRVKGPNSTITWLSIDGQRRIIAGRRVLSKHAEIEVVDLEEEPIELTPEKCDELTSKAISMFNRQPLSSYELSGVAERMRTEGRELAQIARTIHRSESWVSKMLKARGTASPKLLRAWKIGEITDEQFKDLAAQKDAERQAKDVAEVVETRKTGDKTEARTKAKEVVETVKAKDNKKAKAAADKEAKAEREANKQLAKDFKAAKAKPVVSGDQQEMWKAPEAKPKKPTTPSKASLEEIVELADKRPPTHDYVKGFVAGIAHTQGKVELADLPKPWAAWISRVGGSAGKKTSTEMRTFPVARGKKPRAKATKAKVKAKAHTKKNAKPKKPGRSRPQKSTASKRKR